MWDERAARGELVRAWIWLVCQIKRIAMTRKLNVDKWRALLPINTAGNDFKSKIEFVKYSNPPKKSHNYKKKRSKKTKFTIEFVIIRN